MPQAAKNLLLILLIPILLAVGHDVYFNYFSDDKKINEIKNLQIEPENFMVSDLGWVWSHYSPNTLEMLNNSVSQETWVKHINPVLQQTTIFVSSVPFIAGVIFLIFTFTIGIWPFTRYGKKSSKHPSNHGVYKYNKENKVKYSKK